MEMGGVQQPGALGRFEVPEATVVPEEVHVTVAVDEEQVERLTEERDEARADAAALYGLARDMLAQAQTVDQPEFEERLASYEQKYAEAPQPTVEP